MPTKNTLLLSWVQPRNAKMIKIRKTINETYHMNWLKEETV